MYTLCFGFWTREITNCYTNKPQILSCFTRWCCCGQLKASISEWQQLKPAKLQLFEDRGRFSVLYQGLLVCGKSWSNFQCLWLLLAFQRSKYGLGQEQDLIVNQWLTRLAKIDFLSSFINKLTDFIIKQQFCKNAHFSSKSKDIEHPSTSDSTSKMESIFYRVRFGLLPGRLYL